MWATKSACSVAAAQRSTLDRVLKRLLIELERTERRSGALSTSAPSAYGGDVSHKPVRNREAQIAEPYVALRSCASSSSAKGGRAGMRMGARSSSC
jgi:hypothetical protein